MAPVRFQRRYPQRLDLFFFLLCAIIQMLDLAISHSLDRGVIMSPGLTEVSFFKDALQDGTQPPQSRVFGGFISPSSGVCVLQEVQHHGAPSS